MIKTYGFIERKHSFWTTKGYLLRGKSIAFETRNTAPQIAMKYFYIANSPNVSYQKIGHKKIFFPLYCSHLIFTLASPKILPLDNKKKKILFSFVLSSLNRIFADITNKHSKTNQLLQLCIQQSLHHDYGCFWRSWWYQPFAQKPKQEQ